MLYTDRADEIREVVLTDGKVSLAEFMAVSRYHARVCLTPEYEERVCEGRRRFQEVLDSGKAVYGVNTGFGDNVRFRISDDEMSRLQENIIRSHATAVGQSMSEEQVRSLFFMMLIKACFGCSGIRYEAMELAAEYLNQDLLPYVPSEGSIGGLTYEPYAVMTMTGEGRFLKDGKLVPAAEMLKCHNLKPLKVGPKEGFALIMLMNSSACPALLALYDMVDALRHSFVCASLVCEALQTADKAFDPRLLEMKEHPESRRTAAWMRAALAGSRVMEKSRNVKVQDCTGIRMLPHMLGAVGRRIAETYQVMMEELRSVTDNPVFLPGGVALMGFNFDASYISIYSDSLAIAAAMLSKLLEAYIERLMDSKLSGLPHFLVKKPGLNNGYMIVQYATAGLTADIGYLASPICVSNTRVSAGQETPNLLGDCAGWKLMTVAKKLKNVAALTTLTALQAIDFLDTSISPVNAKAYQTVREEISFMEEDDLIYERIEAIQQILDRGKLLDLYQKEIGPFPF